MACSPVLGNADKCFWNTAAKSYNSGFWPNNMQGNSRQIQSSQTTVHDKLQNCVEKHLNSDFKRPYADHSLRAFEQFMQAWQQSGLKQVILDSACGTGESSLLLAQRYPQHFILGADKSAARVNKISALPPNCLVLRADMLDIWRLLVEHQVTVSKQYLLYPNPWPKLHQLQRRWHGSPILKSILALNSEIELRSNWSVYVEEFHLALQLADRPSQILAVATDTEALSPFEKKYRNSAHKLWACYAKA